MFKNKYLSLKKIYCRAHHLLLGFPILLSQEKVEELGHDLYQIAKEEEKLNLLEYIKIEL